MYVSLSPFFKTTVGTAIIYSSARRGYVCFVCFILAGLSTHDTNGEISTMNWGRSFYVGHGVIGGRAHGNHFIGEVHLFNQLDGKVCHIRNL